MAHGIVKVHDRIVREADDATGKLLIEGTDVTVERVLAGLAATLDVAELVREHPALTHDDVRAVLIYARDRIQTDAASPASAVHPMSPQEFYAQVTRRPDVAELMRRLAR